MRVTHIHAINFRSLADIDLDLTDDGMTALVGHPGSGKSSIISAIPFVLFGDTGTNGTLVDLRRRGSSDKDRCGATITFHHGQDTITASRWLTRTRPRGTIKETAHATLTINGQPVDGITPSRLTTEMSRILGVTRDAFRGAAFIGQGEVDTLATATCAEVQKLVEHHTGLAPLTKERDRQRHTARDAVNTAAALPGSADDLERLTCELATAAERGAHARHVADTCHVAATAAKTRLTDARSRLDTLLDAERAAHASRDALVAARAVAHARHLAATEAAERLTTLGADPTVTGDQITTRAATLEAAHSQLVAAGTAYSHQLADTRRLQHTAHHTAERAQSTDTDALTTSRATLSSDLQRATERAEQAHRTHAVHTAEADRLRRAITQLDTADTQACCPTCRQPLDDLAALRAQFHTDLETAHTHANQATTQARDADNDAADLQRRIDTIDTQLRDADHARRDHEHAQATLADAAARTEKAAHTLTEAIHAANPDTHLATDCHGDALLDAGRAAARSLTAQLRDLDTLARALTDAQQARDAAHTADKTVSDTEHTLTDAPSPEAITAARNTVTRHQHAFDEAATEAADAERACSALEVAHAHAAAAHTAEQQRWDAKQAALAEAEIATGIATCIDALRTELLAEFTGNISAAATELLALFGGEHVAFHLDADFTPRVELADGTLVETKTLSGGEKARAGLAFRLGITMQITRGGIPDQIIGDEVTNYLDDDGRRAIIATLQQQFPSVLLISHTPEALDVASRVIALDRAPLEPTTITSGDTDPGQPLPRAS